MNSVRLVIVCCAVFCVCAFAFGSTTVHVRDSSELSRALADCRPGTTILLEPGQYRGGIYINGICGRKDLPIVIRGKIPANPPVFIGGGGQAIHLSDCNFVKLAYIRVDGYTSNGINIDDGGSFDTPARHIVLEDVTITATGPNGNHDALKMSGVDEFIVRNCQFEGWGGSGIDMVGCHAGKVTGCTFVGKEGFSQSNAVQLKGGTARVLVEKCLFRNVGHRSINLGGSTGLQFFRPRVDDHEAKDIEIAGNTFVGSVAPVAWVTASGGHVHHNTFIYPDKWVLRILQETTDTRFKRCHGGIFENNLIIYDSRIGVFVNVGPRTAPETFVFRKNAWRRSDGETHPILPTPERDGLYDVDVSVDLDKPIPSVRINSSRPGDAGAHAYKASKD